MTQPQTSRPILHIFSCRCRYPLFFVVVMTNHSVTLNGNLNATTYLDTNTILPTKILIANKMSKLKAKHNCFENNIVQQTTTTFKMI